MAALLQIFAILTTLTITINCAGSDTWWKHGVFYQIYPRSFKDSDGDGVGDIQGIISKLEHLKEAGVTAAWLSPIYKSPQVDAGYDISDYVDIHEEYGTLDDFDQMVQKAKELGIKIVMDFVPNHSSNLHEWFKKSENREPGYEDYYVWEDGKNNDDVTPPNNWVSVFKYSAWEYSKIRKQWYLHQFAKEQPDLNFKNRKVVEEMKNVLKFWMDRGVYGFRIDAVPHIFETGLEDEPIINPNLPSYSYDYLDHVLTKDQPETFELIYEFRDSIEQYNKEHDDDDRIMMTEAYSSITNTMKYYGNGERVGANFGFNFEMIPLNSASSARDIIMTIKKWMTYMPLEYTPNWVIGNHDNHRVASRVGKANADSFNMLVAVLPGVAVTFNGEEIGMEDGAVSWEQGQDPSACNGLPEDFNATSRDVERTPYHWDSTKNAGFTTGDSTWLPVSEKYLDNNLEAQKSDPNSHFSIYQKLTALRKSSGVLQNGKLQAEAYSDKVFVIRRYKVGQKAVILLANISEKPHDVNLSKLFEPISDKVKVLVSNKAREGSLSSHYITLGGNEGLIVEEL